MAVADNIFTHGPDNVTQLLATTVADHRAQIADNIFTAIPLFAHLAMKNRITAEGGSTLVRPILFVKNTTAASYASDDVLDTTIQDEFTAAQYIWRQYAVTVAIPGRLERIQNAGKAQIVNVVEGKIQAAQAAVKDLLDRDLFETLQVGTRISPINAIIDNTGTVGDINGATSTFWQSTVTTSGSFAAQGLSDLRGNWNQLTQRNPVGPPDMLLSDRTAFEAYEATVVPQLRLTDVELGNLGFENLRYKSAPWTFDVNATSGVIYLINSKALELVQHSGTMFVMSEWVKPSSQDVRVAQIFWAGELTTVNRRKLGKLTGVTA